MILPGLLLLVAYPVVFFILLGSYHAAKQRQALYHRAPPCGPSGQVTGAALPCYSYADMSITRKDYTAHRRSQSQTDYNLYLRNYQGSIQTEQVSSAFWNSVAVGNTVSAKTWNDTIVAISDGQDSSDTHSSPDYAVSQTFGGLIWMNLIPIVGITLIVVSIKRKLAAQRSQPSK